VGNGWAMVKSDRNEEALSEINGLIGLFQPDTGEFALHNFPFGVKSTGDGLADRKRCHRAWKGALNQLHIAHLLIGLT